MDNAIVVSLTMFSLNQTIFIQKDGNVSTKSCLMDDLPDVVLDLCKEYSINNVKINGYSSYGCEIANKISLNEKILYSENKINVEVI